MAGAALLIGNGGYRRPYKALRTPKDDAHNLGDRLAELGVTTFALDDLVRSDMGKVIHLFSLEVAKLPARESVFFYFAGHGIQRAGENYLVPVDATGADEDEILWSCIGLSDVLKALCLRDDLQKLIVIDACRTNELPGVTRSGPAGLAGASARRYEGIRDTVILYATEPGHVALDGADKGSSPLCRGLLDAFKQPNRSIRQLIEHVTEFVCNDTNDAQCPWDTGTVRRSRSFVASAPETVPPVNTPEWVSFVSRHPHLCHKFQAKDANGRAASYVVFVPPAKETAFLEAIDESVNGSTDLECFGVVLGSDFGDKLSERTKSDLHARFGFNV